MSESTARDESNYAKPTEGVTSPVAGGSVPEGHSTYRGAPYHDNPVKLPEAQPEDSGEGEEKDGSAPKPSPTYTQPTLPGTDPNAPSA